MPRSSFSLGFSARRRKTKIDKTVFQRYNENILLYKNVRIIHEPEDITTKIRNGLLFHSQRQPRKRQSGNQRMQPCLQRRKAHAARIRKMFR